MAIDFPNSPTTGDTHTVNGRTWTYDGTGWIIYGPSIDATVLRIDSDNNRVGINNSSPTVTLDVTGDTKVSGNLAVGSIADVEADITTAQGDINNLESRPVETKTASYVLVASDVNKRIVMNNAGATTITVNDGVFAAGDSVWIHNIGAGTTTVTAGTATVNTAASLDLGQWEGGNLYFTSASNAIFFRGGTVNPATPEFVEYVVVAGGGGGGNYAAGGGGGGGYRSSHDAETSGGGSAARFPFQPTVSTAYTVTVGGGGATAAPGATGGSSVLGPISCTGGGGGGTYNQNNDTSGGSGGGAGAPGGAGTIVGSAGTADEGYASGNGINTSGVYYKAGGGGGAAAVGSSANTGSPGAAGNGGAGRASSITGSSVTRAGGGGGGTTKHPSYPESSGGSGGAGGGGNGGGDTYSGTAGTANTGGGGGGKYAGGSGIVIIKFSTLHKMPTIGAGLTYSTANSTDDHWIVEFTAGSDTITWS